MNSNPAWLSMNESIDSLSMRRTSLWFRAAVPDGRLQTETLPAAANLATPRFFYGSRVKCNFHPPLVKILTIKYNTTPGLNLQAPLPKTVRWFAAAHPVAHAGLFTGNGTA
jgi:hypothetical protein